MAMVELICRAVLSTWMETLSGDGPAGVSTSTPARAYQAVEARPRVLGLPACVRFRAGTGSREPGKNCNVWPCHWPSTWALAGASTRISSGEPASTTAGVRVIEGDWLPDGMTN